jgi:hypothetical protein
MGYQYMENDELSWFHTCHRPTSSTAAPWRLSLLDQHRIYQVLPKMKEITALCATWTVIVPLQGRQHYGTLN